MNLTPSTINTKTDICNSFRAEMLDAENITATSTVAEDLNMKCLREGNHAAASFFIPAVTETEDGFNWGYLTSTWAVDNDNCENLLTEVINRLIIGALQFEESFGLDINDFVKACNFGLLMSDAPETLEVNKQIEADFDYLRLMTEDVNDAGDYALKVFINQHARAICAEGDIVGLPEEE